MTDFTGTAGDDVFNGTSGTDTFNMSQGGRDQVFGDDGDDTFNFGAELRANDEIDGGLGSSDLLTLAGDYSGGLVFKNSTMTGIEAFVVGAGFDYNFTFRDGNFSGAFLIDASDLGASNSLTLDATADTDTPITAFGGDGDDVIKTGAGNDTFLVGFGNDAAYGGAGVETFQFNTNSFGIGDFIDGGADTDFLSLVGDYSAGLTITKDMIDSIEVLFIGGTFDYDLTFANKAADVSMTINAAGVTAGFNAVIDAHAEKSANFLFIDSQNNDTFIGGGGNDFCNLTNGSGNETIQTRGGLDSIMFTDDFTRRDEIDGGAGADQLNLSGDYSGGVAFKASTIENIETIVLAGGFSYSLTLDDGNIATGGILSVQCNSFGVLDELILDATAELDGTLFVQGGIGDDVVLGGAGIDNITGGDGHDILRGYDGGDILTGNLDNDTLDGGNGADVLNGGEGADRLDGDNQADTFVYVNVSESTSTVRDALVTFNATVDKFDLAGAVSGIDAMIAVGALSGATFDADLATAVNAAALAVGHAVIFTPDSGTLAGRTYLIVESGGGAGYQAAQDLVMEIEVGANLNLLSTSNFI